MEQNKGLWYNMLLKPEVEGGSTHPEMLEWIGINMLVPETGFSDVFEVKIPEKFWKEEWYIEHKGKWFLPQLVAYMISGYITIVPIWAPNLEILNLLVENILKMMADFRKMFGIDETKNAGHRPDCVKAAIAEDGKIRQFKIPENRKKSIEIFVMKNKPVYKLTTSQVAN